MEISTVKPEQGECGRDKKTYFTAEKSPHLGITVEIPDIIAGLRRKFGMSLFYY